LNYKLNTANFLAFKFSTNKERMILDNVTKLDIKVYR